MPGPPNVNPQFGVGPNPANWGTVEVGAAVPLSFGGGGFAGNPPIAGVINSITLSDVHFVLSGISLPANVFPATPFASGSVSWTVTLTATGVGVIHATMTVVTSLGTFVVPLTATAVAPGTELSFGSGTVVFPSDIVGAVDNVNLEVFNNTAGNITITAILFTDDQITSSEPLPVTIPAGGFLPAVPFQATHALLGTIAGVITFVTGAGNVTIASSVTTVPFVEVDPLLGSQRDLIFAFQDKSGQHMPDATDLNFGLDCLLVFNGAIYNNPGNEKTLRRLEVYYENIGLCNQGLQLTLKAWRPTLNPPAFDTQVVTISLGDASPDSSERSAFFDVNLSGEIIVMQLVRLANTGPVSLIGFIPHFEDKGEKVEGV